MTRLTRKTVFRTLAFFLGGACLVILAPRTWAKSAAKGGEIFQQKCVMCHAKNGSGNAAMKVPDLRSKEAQKKSDAQLSTIIAKGIPPMMPAYGNQLSKEDIANLVAYIRELGKKKH